MKKSLKFLNNSIVFTLMILSFNARAEFEFTDKNDCTEKRLDQPPEASSKVPVQDQDGVGLCAAYTSTQLIDAWRVKYDQPVDDLTSPLAFGVQFANKTQSNRLANLPTITMLEYSKNLNSCSYNVVRDEFNSKRSADFINELAENYDRAQKNPSQRGSAAQAVLNCVLNGGNYPHINIEKINRYFDEKHWVGFTNKIMEDLCGNNQKSLASLPDVVKKQAKNYKNHAAAMNDFRPYINERLNQKNPLPIGINYCKKVLKDRDANGITDSGILSNQNCPDDAHASVIVGRRLLKYKDGNKINTICQYLVRNSYGSSCNSYDKYEADGIPSKPGGEKPKICENGQIWVDENALLKNTAEIFHLKDK